MKGKRITKLLALLVAALMAVFVSLPAMADGTANTYTAIPGTTTTFTKYLVVRKGETNPAVTFTFAVSAPENAIADTDTTLGVKPGPNPTDVVVGEAAFAAGEANTASSTSDGVDTTNPTITTFTEGYTYGTKPVTINFANVTFDEPGVYRYYITEQACTNSAFGIDPIATRTVDVYVENDSANPGALKVAGYVMYLDKITVAPGKNATGAVDDVPNGAEAGTKSNKFTNTYPTNTLKLTKTVAGNQGSKDKYFKFTVKVESNSIVDTAHYAISGLDNPATINSATKYSDLSNNAPNNGGGYLTGAQLKAGYDIYLQDDDDVVIYGIPIGANYTITEDQEEYTPSWVITRDTSTTPVDSDNSNVASENAFPTNTIVAFTNEKTGVIPTGVIVSAAGLLVVGVIAIIGFVFFGTRSKRRYEED